MRRPRYEIEKILFPVISVITGVALILELAGYFLPYWYENEDVHVGLFMVSNCSWNGSCINTWYDEEGMSWLKSDLIFSRWFQTAAVILGFFSFLASLLQMMNRRSSQSVKNVFHTTFFTLALLAGFTAVIGVLLFVNVEGKESEGWCFIFTVIAGFLWLGVAVISCAWCRELSNDYDERLLARNSYLSTKL